MAEDTKVKKEVKEWTKEEKDAVVNSFLEDICEHIANRLSDDPETNEMLKDGYEISIVVDKDGDRTYYDKYDE